MRRSSLASGLVSAALAASAVAACAAARDERHAAAEDGEGAGEGGAGLDVAPAGGGTSNAYGCSADLQKVVDGNGNLIEQCPPDQGCAPPGECVPACDAAAASRGTVGCEFTVPTPHFFTGINPPCFAVFVANNWPKEAMITIERGGQSYDATHFARIPDGTPNATAWPPIPATGVPPGEVAVLFLSHDPTSTKGGQPLTCPIAPAVSADFGTAVFGTGRGRAWRISADVPVSSYDILPYGGAASHLPSAELLLPTSAWGNNYVAVLPKDSLGPPWGQVVASEDDTTVEIVPTVDLPDGPTLPDSSPTVAAAPANQKTSYTLQAGEIIQWQHTEEMTGSIIQSDKPIAFVGGNAYVCYTSQGSSGGGCDSAHQMIPPIAAFGSKYVAPPYPTRRNDGLAEWIPYRIVGAAEGTSLTYDPPVAGAPATIGLGQRADFESDVPFVVESQGADHPFYVGQIMTGSQVNGGFDGELGDEEYVNILPPAQFLSKYVFFTDPTYPTTNLSIVRSKTADGFKDVGIECIGEIAGWVPVGSGGEYEIAWVDLVKAGASVGGCSNGPQVATSDGPFGIMVWGTAAWASYAYPAGGNVAPINTVVVPPVPK